jgi:hypothetical protein
MLDETQRRIGSEFKTCRRGVTTKEVLIIVVLAGLVVALLLPAVQRSTGGGFRPRCQNNLKQIGLSLHNYHEEYGSIPPAYVIDQDGRPLYSWRVLILPFVDQAPLYNKLHLDEPWDSPHNRPLLDVDMPVFRCPTDKRATDESGTEFSKGMTNYFAVVGPETMWPAPNVCRFEDVTDGLSNTILVVEVANSGIHWAEPRDLHVTQMAREVNPSAGMGLSSRHTGGTHVIFGDGRVQFISDDTPPEQLRAMLTRAGGEVIDDDD